MPVFPPRSNGDDPIGFDENVGEPTIESRVLGRGWVLHPASRDAPMLSSFPEAIEWARDHWGDAPVPYRLHQRDLDDGGVPQFSASFLRALSARAHHTYVGEYVDVCRHRGVEPSECQECGGSGAQLKRGEVYRYPMAAALQRLVVEAPVDPGRPSAAQLVVLLARCGWRAEIVAKAQGMPLDLVEALSLRALRKLENRYAMRPAARAR